MKKLKKLVTGILALAVVMVSTAPMLSVSASAAFTDKEVTVYFQNSKSWKNVYAYLWHGSGNLKGTPAWPGKQMTKVSGTSDWYELKFSPAMAFSVIFNDNAQPKPQQTANHTPKDLTADKPAYWFVPTDATQTNGNGYTPTGVAVKVYSEAQSGFPTPSASTGTSNKAATATAAAPTNKDASPKTGDTGTGMTVVVTVAAVALAGMGFVLARKKTVS